MCGGWQRGAAGRVDEDEDSVASVVVNGDVKLVLNGLRQSELMGRNKMCRRGGLCVRTVVFGILFCCCSSTSGYIFNHLWLSMNHLKCVIKVTAEAAIREILQPNRTIGRYLLYLGN